MALIFRDNFFSAGETEIQNEAGAPAGRLDLKSAFNASIDVYDGSNRLVCSGKFPFFSGKWSVLTPGGDEIGRLRSRFSLGSKRFEYDARHRGLYEIRSPLFSREYEILDESGSRVAFFEKVSGFFSSGAFRLTNSAMKLNDYELVAVIMGMYAIQKRNSAAANSSANP
ncbi:hypothetical protein [Gorillibacterium timonense]|uniref:hypothetical protein n=1 Tax=Gorillibacterium timonense TaxID=1689269 RepID=UPI00071DFD7D|nr:hypothetical protein [Gorillibacterium timonense]